ncbi:putative MATE family efflux protein [Elusimicrobium simillimum]|uniref:MATE family efflux transporter n=1 Tax=Elusimicrobium simillimum TaxID=3143438 RepID=UPI003C6F3F94
MTINAISSVQDGLEKERNPFKGKSLQAVLFKFSAPAVIGILVNAMYNVADRAFIGHALGPDGIAGITVGFPLTIFVMACSIMFGVGGSVLFSINLGKKDYKKAERVMGNTVIALIVVISALSIFWIFTMDFFLTLLGASETVLPYARDYMKILLIGAPVQAIGMGMNNYLRATGNPKMAMVTMIIGAIINCILGPLFIFVFKWGMEGAALGVIISQLVSAVWVMAHFVGKKAQYRLRLKCMKPDFKIIKSIMSIGSSQFIMNSASCVLNIVLNLTLVGYGGDLAISAMGIVTSVNTLLIMPVIGIAQGVQPIIGYYYGAKYYARMLQFLKKAIVWSTAITTASFILIMLFSTYIVRIFNNDNQVLLDLSSYALRVFNIGVPLVGFQVIASTFFQATAKPVKAIILTLARQILILLPLIIVLPAFMGLNGIFIASPVSDITVFTLAFYFLRREVKKYIRTV